VTIRYVRQGLKLVRVDGAAPSRGEPPWDVTNSEDGPTRVPDFAGDFNGDPTDPRARLASWTVSGAQGRRPWRPTGWGGTRPWWS
jgi:hypothetical protein